MLRVISFFMAAFTLSGAVAQEGGWTSYRNDRFGFSFRYPAGVFELERSSEAGDGQVFVGMRGHGRLLVGALHNTEGYSLEGYRRLVASKSYPGLNIDYAPRGQSWFVLSGEGDGRVFYEKVMFSCGGRLINSFILIYPAESKSDFDPIVTGIEKTFRPGQDCGRHATQ